MKSATPAVWQPGWKSLLALGLLAWLVFLLVSFPAARAWAWWGANVPGVQVASVQGTIWRGQLRGVSYDNFSARSVSWELAPLSLLRLRASLDLDVRLEDGFVTSQILAAPSGTVKLSDLQGQVALPVLAPMLELPPNMVEGQVNFGFERVLIDDLPRQAQGRATLNQAGFRIGRRLTELGNYVADIHTNEQQVLVADIRDQGQGPLAVEGAAQFNPANGSYNSNLLIQVRDSDTDLARMLESGLNKDRDGNFVLNYNGRLQLP